MDRRCPTCATFKDETLFDEHPDGRLHRDCIPCEEARAARRAQAKLGIGSVGWNGKIGVEVPKEFRGVDIDAIHYKRGLVRAKKAA